MDSDHVNTSSGADGKPVQADNVVPKQPAGSQIALLETQDALTAVIPPAQFNNAGSAQIIMGVLILLSAGSYLAVLILAWFNPGIIRVSWDNLGGFPMIVICILAGVASIGVMLRGVHMGRCNTVLTINATEFILIQSSFLHKKELSWPLSAIQDIRCVFGPPKIGEYAAYENAASIVLQILIRDHDALELFMDHDETELAWLAQELKSALKLRGFNPGVCAESSQPH